MIMPSRMFVDHGVTDASSEVRNKLVIFQREKNNKKKFVFLIIKHNAWLLRDT